MQLYSTKILDDSVSVESSLDSFQVVKGAGDSKQSSMHRPPPIKHRATVPCKQLHSINLPDLAPKKQEKKLLDRVNSGTNTTGAAGKGPPAPADNRFIPAQVLAPRRKQT